MVKHICVIGSGASGLTGIKACIDEGFKVTCYEQSDFVGGLWKYRDEDVDNLASVARTTIINSSKEMSAYSDFPPPPEVANYMHNTAMHAYFESYADHFNLKPHVQFKHKVIKVEQSDLYEKTGQWRVTALNLTTNKEVSIIFDGVLVCTGHHVKPLVPTFKGQEKFKGQIIHTHSYKKPQPFEDKRVVVVGIGNSGGDAAVELSMFAKKVYLAIRSGTWIHWRLGTKGQPMDSEFIRRFYATILSLVGYKLVSYFVEFLANLRFDHETYCIKPDHRMFEQHPTVNDTLSNRFISGTVIAKNNIKEFTENGIIFDEDDGKETPVDCAILATGYEISFPFLNRSLVWSDKGQISLFKQVFSPNIAHPHTLAFIGLIQPLGPLIPVSELQCRWFAQLMAGNVELPSRAKMITAVEKERAEHNSRYYSSPRHQIQIDYATYVDDIAAQFGVKPNLTKLFLTDPILWFHVYFGPMFPYHFRISGPRSWPNARKTILTAEERIQAPFKTRKLKKPKSKLINLNFFGLIIPLLTVIIYFIKLWLQ